MPPRGAARLGWHGGSFFVFYLQDFKTDVFKTLQNITSKIYLYAHFTALNEFLTCD
jgi:hypothetical protein